MSEEGTISGHGFGSGEEMWTRGGLSLALTAFADKLMSLIKVAGI